MFFSGGINFCVGFIEFQYNLVVDDVGVFSIFCKLNCFFEYFWFIGESFKNENLESLFLWIGDCIVYVVCKGCDVFSFFFDQDFFLGVMFSFFMYQILLFEVKLMVMGKGFVIMFNLDFGGYLIIGYEKYKIVDMLNIKIVVIVNDFVLIFVFFICQFFVKVYQKVVMGVIVGMGCNVIIFLKFFILYESKCLVFINVLFG